MKTVELSLAKAKMFYKEKIYTEIASNVTFFPAEDYHQDYYKKNPIRYNYYKYSCGREQRIKQLKINLR